VQDDRGLDDMLGGVFDAFEIVRSGQTSPAIRAEIVDEAGDGSKVV